MYSVLELKKNRKKLSNLLLMKLVVFLYSILELIIYRFLCIFLLPFSVVLL